MVNLIKSVNSDDGGKLYVDLVFFKETFLNYLRKNNQKCHAIHN